MSQNPEAAVKCRLDPFSDPFSGCGPVGSVNRIVRTRLIGGVGLGEKNPRLPDWKDLNERVS